MLNIPLIQQLDRDQRPSNMCGAACLQMILKYLGQNVDQNEIWKNIMNPKYNRPTNYDITRYANDRGAIACTHRSTVNNYLRTVAYLVDNNIPTILFIQYAISDPSTHNVVLIDFDKMRRATIVNDPMKATSRKIKSYVLPTLWGSVDDRVPFLYVTFGHKVAVVPCPKCGEEIPMNEYFEQIDRLEDGYTLACPHCNRFFKTD